MEYLWKEIFGSLSNAVSGYDYTNDRGVFLLVCILTQLAREEVSEEL